ncbi:hypothetical protein [Streptomyces sp. NPDC007346]|uniref:hypothetical protein n=1 Tax=Streptomyces sp. NPDC007346 TaxID=3154682 RepID=UPI003454E18D
MTRPRLLKTRRETRLENVRLLEGHLSELGLAPTYAVTDGATRRLAPEGLGWCHVLYAAEEAWPLGAESCVIVRWLPDEAFQYDHRAERVPAGAAEHWRERTAATMQALQGLGYQAAVTGPPRLPHLHAAEDILVWRAGEGAAVEPWPPVNAWSGAAPARPSFSQPEYLPGEQSPVDVVDEELRCTPAPGMAFALDAPAVLWPAYAESCVRVLWQPDAEYRRRPDGTVPSGAAEHWKAGTGRVHEALKGAGYRVQRSERATSPVLDDDAGFLAWRRRPPRLPVSAFV